MESEHSSPAVGDEDGVSPAVEDFPAIPSQRSVSILLNQFGAAATEKVEPEAAFSELSGVAVPEKFIRSLPDPGQPVVNSTAQSMAGE